MNSLQRAEQLPEPHGRAPNVSFESDEDLETVKLDITGVYDSDVGIEAWSK